MTPPDKFDVIVVGGGHAGCESALAAARMGQKCLLVTINLDHIAALSCNPAVGGLAKGHLVREIDAMGGQMGLAADAAGIQFRLLNRSKGAAVWSSRAQVDMDLYPKYMRNVCLNQESLWLLDSKARGLIIENGRAAGVTTDRGHRIAGRSVVLTTGTFLRGLIHVGLRNWARRTHGRPFRRGPLGPAQRPGFEPGPPENRHLPPPGRPDRGFRQPGDPARRCRAAHVQLFVPKAQAAPDALAGSRPPMQRPMRSSGTIWTSRRYTPE